MHGKACTPPPPQPLEAGRACLLHYSCATREPARLTHGKGLTTCSGQRIRHARLAATGHQTTATSIDMSLPALRMHRAV